MLEHGLLQALIYLGAAALFVPIFKRIGLGSVLGYLVAGIAIGPWASGLISQTDVVQEVSELGVVLLMFLVGLELNPSRLWALKRSIFGLGSLQVLATIGAVAAAVHGLGLSWPTAAALGMAASMSSTAIALQLLNERKLTLAPPGQASFSVALFQDIAVIPLLLGLSLLAPVADGGRHHLPSWQPIATAAALIAVMIVGGRLLLRPLFRWIADIGMREIFISFALLLVVGSALLTESVGLSMAMGSFIAGLLLADSEYRMELEVDIDPLKGLFLGLFFMSVGMSLDLQQVLTQPFVIVGLALSIVLIKIVVMRTLGLPFGLRHQDGWMFALSLSQIGEFAFVLLSEGRNHDVIPANEASLARTVVAVSMLTTPLLFLAYDRWIEPLYTRAAQRNPDRIEERKPVIVVGIGRFGQIIVRLLRARNIDATVIDIDPGQITAVARFGWRTYYGDASRPDVLEAAGVAEARLVVLAFNQPEQVLATARYLHGRYPKLQLLARARGRTDAIELERAGITAIRETFGSALETAERALVMLGDEPLAASRIAERFREHDVELLQQMMHADGEEEARAIYDQGRARFLQLLEAERDEEEANSAAARREAKRRRKEAEAEATQESVSD